MARGMDSICVCCCSYSCVGGGPYVPHSDFGLCPQLCVCPGRLTLSGHCASFLEWAGKGAPLGELSSGGDARLSWGTPWWDKGISDRFSLLSGEEVMRLLRLTRLS